MFSEAIDSVIQRSGRADKKSDIVDYLNSTIRECQAKALFFKDLVEDEIALTSADPLIWSFPIPAPGVRAFRQFRTVMYPDLSYPPLKQPGRIQRKDEDVGAFGANIRQKYYYAATNYVVFNGCGTTTTIDTGFDNNYIGIAYYSWLPRLRYYLAAHRPAVWDDEAAIWTYYDLSADASSSVTIKKNWTLIANQPPNEPNAQDYVTNWLLFDWNEMIKEGTLAKLYKNINDPRSVPSYSLYMQMMKDFLATEAMESLEK